MRARIGAACVLTSLATGAIAAEPPQVIPVPRLAVAPKLDGTLTEWSGASWQRVRVAPAVVAREREIFGLDAEDRNVTGVLEVEVQAGMHGERFYLAARWPDAAADTAYKGWERVGDKYIDNKRHDDAFAVRFQLDGDYDRSMLSAKTYAVDVWYWSAARTNPAGHAEDWTHRLSTRPIENAAEYTVKAIGTVYIKKQRDAGTPVYRMVPRPREAGADRLPAFEINKAPSGSVADVSAKGRWAAGAWSLEMSRKLDTGHADDTPFATGKAVLGQIAVFNRAGDENKSVSEPLLFDFAAAR